MDAAWEDYDYDYDYDYNLSDDRWNYSSGDIYYHNISGYGRGNNADAISEVIGICRFVTCILGAAGNGMVVWLLGFRVQRNPFMTCILNLAIADFGLLISNMILDDPAAFLPSFVLIFLAADFLCILMYSTSQFLLTAISLDRCVAVFFPLWHRCHRPPHLSTIVCALMWVLSFLLTTITYTVMFSDSREWDILQRYQFIVNAVLCLPLVTISTLALFIKVCFKPQQHRRGKLLTVLLLTLAFFLLFAFPLNAILIFSVYGYLPAYFHTSAKLLACLNSSVNPFIYFLVGRQRKTRRRESLKMILQQAFKEEECCAGEALAETQL